MMFKDLQLTWTDRDEAEDYVVPNVLSPRDLVFRPDIMDETVKSSSSSLQIEPRCEKTGLRGFRPGPTQTRLCNHSRWLEV